MAKTNEAIARQAASIYLQAKTNSFSNLSYVNDYSNMSIRDMRSPSAAASHTQNSVTDDGHFNILLLLKSYNTVVGCYVQNRFTKMVELWLTDTRYSNTTTQHLSQYQKQARILAHQTDMPFLLYTTDAHDWMMGFGRNESILYEERLEAEYKTVLETIAGIASPSNPKRQWRTRLSTAESLVQWIENEIHPNVTEGISFGEYFMDQDYAKKSQEFIAQYRHINATVQTLIQELRFAEDAETKKDQKIHRYIAVSNAMGILELEK